LGFLHEVKDSLIMSKQEISEIFSMSGPVLIEQLSVAVMANLVSVLVKGSGVAAVAAVNQLSSLTMLFQQSYLAIGVGVTVVIAQYRGRGDSVNAGEAASESLMLSVYLATIVAFGVYIFREGLLRALFRDSEALVYEYARVYLSMYALALPFIGIYSVSAAIIRGSGHPRQSLIATLIYNGTYGVLASAAVFIFKGGLMSVSLSLLAAAVAAAGVGLYLVKRGNEDLRVKRLIKPRLSVDNMRPMLRVGLPVMLENALFQSGRLITQSFVISYGTNIIAVNGLANNVNAILCVPGMGFANAAPPIVGRYCGMGDKRNAKRKAIQLVLLCMAAMGVMALFMLAILGPYARYYTDIPQVQSAIKAVVTFQCVTMPLMWGIAFVGPAVLRSSGDSKFTSMVTVAAMFTMRIGIGYFFTQVIHLGVTGVWIGMFADWVFRGAFFLPRLIGGKWLAHDLFGKAAA
jgi:putative MATE family efflux protein